MKKKLAVLLLSLCAVIALSSTAFSASDESASRIDVHVPELEPGYYVCAAWDGDTLLCLFDYTVGSDGIMDTTVDIGEALPSGTQVKVGISSANTGGKEIAPVVFSAYNSGDKPSKPAGSLYRIYIPNVTGGTATAPAQSSYAGSSVPLTVTPDLGYALDYIFLTDTAGNRISARYANGQYWFLMPSSDVAVHAAFVPTAQNAVSVNNTAAYQTEISPLSINVFASKTGDTKRLGNAKRVSYSIDFTLSADVTGGSGSYSYLFEIKENGRLTKTTGWTSNPAFSGYISGIGTCIAEITVKDDSGQAAATAVDVLTGKTIKPTTAIAAPHLQSGTTPSASVPGLGVSDGQSLSIGVSSAKSVSIVGSSYSVTFQLAVSAAGGSGGYSYRFEILQNGEAAEPAGWTSNNAISGSLSGNGSCVVAITVRDSSGKTASATVDLLKAA